MKKVLVAMSGGIDSNVAAALLIQNGYEVQGITFDNLEKGDSAVEKAKESARFLGITHQSFNIEEYFRKEIVENFIKEYCEGRTPNPCVRCNYLIKFGMLLNKAKELGCDFLATGHYAKIEDRFIKKGADSKKDQSYFLYQLYAREIDKVMFPLGGMTKNEVKEYAQKSGIYNENFSESQDICFVPDGNCAKFISGCVEKTVPGPIVNIDGKEIGKHNGIQFYTIGQRKGLGALGKPMFVKEIIPNKNTIVASEDRDLFSSVIEIKNVCTGPDMVSKDDVYGIQVRYRSKPTSGKVVEKNENSMILEFDDPVRAIAPGQSAVLYRDDKVIAGGIIS